ncbi:unnamed protein product [marine sediment metagenome]|uniref:Uncharacterized protein n=1 Tax=marine sediment metagenome TaxID=412755 RepID=X1V615_9ZZZZ
MNKGKMKVKNPRDELLRQSGQFEVLSRIFANQATKEGEETERNKTLAIACLGLAEVAKLLADCCQGEKR